MAFEWVYLANLKGNKGDPGGPFNPVAITEGQDLNNFRTTGWYYCRLTATSATVLNRPAGIGDGPFMVEVRATPFNYVSQHFVGYSGAASGVYARNTGNAAGSVFTQWARLDNQTSTGSSGEGGGLANALRVMDFTDRRGVRNTMGKGAVALRFDHGLTKFKSDILPLLRTNGLPSSLALNSRTWTAAENAGATKSDVLSWVASDGVEVWNHGATHIDAADTAALTDEIVNGLVELRAQLPGVVIDGFVVPGVGGTNYGGFGGGATPESFYTTTAGQMILEHHAVSTGAFPGTSHRILDGMVRQGQAHYSIEAQSVAQIKAQIDSAIANKTGLQLMMHPSNLNVAGYLTTAQLSEVLTYIKTKVSAGVLAALSPYELMAADATVAVGEPGPPGAGVPVGGTAKQVIRKNSANTNTEWATLGKVDVGLSAVDNTADVDKPASAAVVTALAGKVGRGELFLNARDYGVVGDGIADDTDALNSAATAAAAKDFTRLFIPAGVYKITGTVSVRRGLDAEQATFAYYGTGTALVLGQDTAGVSTARQYYVLPRIINMSRGTTGWDGASIGVKAVNLNTCEVHIPFVQDFERGLVVYGNGGGNAYTAYHLGALWENHKNLVLDCTSDGYSNQNTFIGGRLQHSLTKGATADDVNANQISMLGLNPEGGPNNNTFLGTSFEGENVAFYRVDIAGRNNYFLNCRWEAPGGQTPRVRYRPTARWNKIELGYNTSNVVEVFDAGGLGGGEIQDGVGAYSSANNTAGQVIPNNVWTAITTWSTPVQRRITYNGGTGEFTPRPGRWRITATVTFAPNATGRRIARVNSGGAVADIDEAPGNAIRSALKLQAVDVFDGTKTVKIECNQTSGADLALETTSPYVKFQAEYLGN